MKHALRTIILLLLVAATFASALRADALDTAGMELAGETRLDAPLLLLEVVGNDVQGASWQGGGLHADLNVQGEAFAVSTDAADVSPSEPITEHHGFDGWSLTGGDWDAGFQVLIGIQPGADAQVSLVGSGMFTAAASPGTQRSQPERFYHADGPVQYEVGPAVQWIGDTPSVVRIEGDFVIAAWSADMAIESVQGSGVYPSGVEETPLDGADAAADVVYRSEYRINNLYVQDGWIELDLKQVDRFDLFTRDAAVATAGQVSATQATAVRDGRDVGAGALEANGELWFGLDLSEDGDALRVLPVPGDGRWTLDGKPLDGLLGGSEGGPRTVVANPFEGDIPVWGQVVGWTLAALLFFTLIEGVGLAPLLRTRWRIATYRYDAVRPRSYWQWFPAAIRFRMYFQAALAAAGREDHENAMAFAACVPASSRQFLPSRFVSIQSLAALGHTEAARHAVAGLVTDVPQYLVLARENPFLRRLLED